MTKGAKDELVKCPSCGMKVAKGGGLSSHQRGNLCRAKTNVKRQTDDGFARFDQAPHFSDLGIEVRNIGDVYIKGYAHRAARIATHYYMPAWVRINGIDHRRAAGDPEYRYFCIAEALVMGVGYYTPEILQALSVCLERAHKEAKEVLISKTKCGRKTSYESYTIPANSSVESSTCKPRHGDMGGTLGKDGDSSYSN